MINLLADERKSEINAARANTVIVRYLGIIILAFLFIGATLAVSYSVTSRTRESAEALIDANDLKASVYSGTKKEVDELSGQLSVTKTILNQEVRYSQILLKIGQLMPAGTVLDDFTLNSTAFNGVPVEMKAYAKSTSEASTLQNQFQSSPIFSQVTLNGTETSGGISGYPVVVNLSVTFNKPGVH